MFRLLLLVLIVLAYIILQLILKCKFKIKKPKYIDVNGLRPQYYMYLLLIALVLSLIMSFAMQSGTYVIIFLVISRIIDSGYKINYFISCA